MKSTPEFSRDDQDADASMSDLLSRPVGRKKRKPASIPEDGNEPGIIRGVVIGVVVGQSRSAAPTVDYPGNPTNAPLQAVATMGSSKLEVGTNVALLFEFGNPRRPVIVGPISVFKTDDAGTNPKTGNCQETKKLRVQIDGERTIITASNEIILRCGKASMTLTKAGKVLLRGTYILSRASGPNKVKGTTVELN